MGDRAFQGCGNLESIFVRGVPFAYGEMVFEGVSFLANVFHDVTAPGWGDSFAGLPVSAWNPVIQSTRESPEVSAGHLGVTICGPMGLIVTIEAADNLRSPVVWEAIKTVTLPGGTVHFTEPELAVKPGRHYSVASD